MCSGPTPRNQVEERRLIPIPALLRKQPTVYRIYSQRRRLLYVGMTNSLPRRLAAHADSLTGREWWANEATHVSVEFFCCMRAAAHAEQIAIWEERPKYNRSGLRARPQPIHGRCCTSSLVEVAASLFDSLIDRPIAPQLTVLEDSDHA